MSTTIAPEWDVLDEAMSDFIADIVVAKSKNMKHKRNMEFRRRLEAKMEEQRLAKEMKEYDFEFSHEFSRSKQLRH